MNKTIFDVLSKDVDLKKEIEKLHKLFSSEKLVKTQYNYNSKFMETTYKELCDKHLALWEFRNTWVSLYDIECEIGVHLYRNPNAEMTCILYCELILNMQKFIKTKIDEKYYKIILDDGILIGNINQLIEKLNYTIIDEPNKVTLVKKNIDAELAAVTVDNNDVSLDILKYNDIRIKNNIKEKCIILFNIYKYYEGQKPKLKQSNNKLCTLIDKLYNTSNIRHNNETGYKENEKFTKLEIEEILQLYDELYFLIIYAIRIPEVLNIVNKHNSDIKN